MRREKTKEAVSLLVKNNLIFFQWALIINRKKRKRERIMQMKLLLDPVWGRINNAGRRIKKGIILADILKKKIRDNMTGMKVAR